MRVAEVGNLQRFLRSLGYTDYQDLPLKADEDLGGRTEFALRCWQKQNGVKLTGVFDMESRLAAIRLGFIPFVQAVNCNVLYPNKRQVTRIAIHTMENSELPFNQAESVADWFANKHAPKYPAPQASPHFNVDRDSIVQSVRVTDVAWHAKGANHNSIGIELAGRHSQSAADWQDEVSQAILRNAAGLCRWLCAERPITVRKLSLEEILDDSESGFLGHVDATKAYKIAGGHVDPGPHFPWTQFLTMIREVA